MTQLGIRASLALLTLAAGCTRNAGSSTQAYEDSQGRCQASKPNDTRDVWSCQKCAQPFQMTAENVAVCPPGQLHSWQEIYPDMKTAEHRASLSGPESICEKNPWLVPRPKGAPEAEIRVFPAKTERKVIGADGKEETKNVGGKVMPAHDHSAMEQDPQTGCAANVEIVSEAQFEASKLDPKVTEAKPSAGNGMDGDTAPKAEEPPAQAGAPEEMPQPNDEPAPSDEAGAAPEKKEEPPAAPGEDAANPPAAAPDHSAKFTFEIGPRPGTSLAVEFTFLKRTTEMAKDLGDADKCRVAKGEKVPMASHVAPPRNLRHIRIVLAKAACGFAVGDAVYLYVDHASNMPKNFLEEVEANALK
jgi:hypothetical protein